MTTPIDVGKKEVLVRFLTEQQIFGTKPPGGVYIRYFEGGVSATVALAALGGQAVIVKQALAKLKVEADWTCSQDRMAIEQKALETYAQLVPDKVPLPLCYDRENYIMVRQAAPESCATWKEQLLSGLLDFEIARKAIDALVVIHNQTAGQADIAHAFADSRFFRDLRISPYIENVAEKHPQIADLAKEVVTQLLTERICLTHGDYSPKNILVDARNIFILDYEVSYYGHPGFDVAFFTNHFLLKAIKNRSWSESYLNMLLYMTDRYFGAVDMMDAAMLEAQTIRVLGLLLLARVDGKSPAEYITKEEDKRAVRSLALEICAVQPHTYAELVQLFRTHVL